MKTYQITDPWLHTHCKLGEAPHWDKDQNTFRFVDIISKEVHTVDLSAGISSHRAHHIDFSIGCTAEIEGRPDVFVFGGKEGYGIFTKKTGECQWIRKFDWAGITSAHDLAARQRSNDGVVDAHGRFLVGTMDDGEVVPEPQREGQVFSLSGSTLTRVFGPVTIPNGASFSPDNKSIYLTDSPTHTIRKYPYDLSTGTIDPSTSEVLIDTSPRGLDLGGVPDGHCRDAEGCFWVAVFGAGAVYRVSETGRLLAKVEVPTRSVTCCALVGTELFITTAHDEDPEKYPESARLQGAVFKVDVGVRGAPLNKFVMAA